MSHEAAIEQRIERVKRDPALSGRQRQRALGNLQRQLQQAQDLHEAGGEAQTHAEALQEQFAAEEAERDAAAEARIQQEVEARETGGSNWAIDQEMKKLGIY